MDTASRLASRDRDLQHRRHELLRRGQCGGTRPTERRDWTAGSGVDAGDYKWRYRSFCGLDDGLVGRRVWNPVARWWPVDMDGCFSGVGDWSDWRRPECHADRPARLAPSNSDARFVLAVSRPGRGAD